MGVIGTCWRLGRLYLFSRNADLFAAYPDKGNKEMGSSANKRRTFNNCLSIFVYCNNMEYATVL